MAIIVQLVTRNNKVLSSHKVESDIATIGRGYDNDIILQDEHVCPNHAEVTLQNGELVLKNLSDINGIKTLNNGPVEQTKVIQSGDTFVFGKVVIRILTPDHPVAPTRNLNIFEDISHSVNRWFVAVSFAIVFFLSFTYQSYIGTIDEIIWSKLIAKSLMLVLGLALLPALIALLTWLFKREFKFFAAASFCFCLIILLHWLSAVSSVLYFNVGFPKSLVLLSDIIELVIFVVFFWGALYLMSNMSQKKISVISVSLVAVFYVLTYLSNQNDKVILAPNYAAKVFSDSFLFVTPVTAESYTSTLESQFKQAAEEAVRRNEEADEFSN
ncbi:MAG: FHA domain-containing protein [Gammaproteobacteria bacterium]|nr:FHA domain-containing protein [Gammaproteobacteria bacterium]